MNLFHALLVNPVLKVDGLRGFATSCHHIACIDQVAEARFEVEKRVQNGCEKMAKVGGKLNVQMPPPPRSS